jgi:hypothetical protein
MLNEKKCIKGIRVSRCGGNLGYRGYHVLVYFFVYNLDALELLDIPYNLIPWIPLIP